MAGRSRGETSTRERKGQTELLAVFVGEVAGDVGFELAVVG